MKPKEFSKDAFYWALQGISALRRKAPSTEPAWQEPVAPDGADSLLRSAHACGFDTVLRKTRSVKPQKELLPSAIWLDPATAVAGVDPHHIPAPVMPADAVGTLLLDAGAATPISAALADLSLR